MSRENYGVGKWQINGPRALAWLAAEVPKRSSLRGIAEDCSRALHLPVSGQRLTDWLGDTGRDQWAAIRRTLGTGNGKGPIDHDEPSPVAMMPGLSLAEYVKAKKRAACPVCALPTDVLACLATAGDKGFKVDEQLEWLTQGRGYAITRDDLMAHRGQRHGQ